MSDAQERLQKSLTESRQVLRPYHEARRRAMADAIQRAMRATYEQKGNRMSDTKHTELPWTRCVLELEGPEGKQSKTVALQHQIRALSLPLAVSHVAIVAPNEQGEANAEFIVRACNAHDDLLAACEDAAFVLGKVLDKDIANWERSDGLHNRLRAAIAKAQEATK